MASKILVLNAGSSSLKFKLFEGTKAKLRAIIGGLVDRIGDIGNSELVISAGGAKEHHKEPVEDHTAALEAVLSRLKQSQSSTFDKEVSAVGHRVVHGMHKSEPMLVNAETIRLIEEAAALAPLHNRANLQGIRAAQKIFVGKPEVVVFDTAFHQTMPPSSYMYALPYELYKAHSIRKYGFHGTSVKYLVKETSRLLGKPADSLDLIVAHIGAGASITAVKAGKVIDTSMGLTPLEGLMMGTRCGDIDPAVVVHLQSALGMSPDQVDKLLNKQSGFLGLAGTADLRAVMEGAAQGSERSKLAYEVYVHRIRKYLGSYLVLLNGKVDAIIFSAGVGENSAALRYDALASMEEFGISVDEARNVELVGGKEGEIQDEGSRTKVLVVPTDEELSIAEQTLEVVNSCNCNS